MTVRHEPGPGGANLSVLLRGLKGVEGRTGFFENARYPDGTSVAYVATIQEFGYAPGGIPPRPFMRPTADAKSAEWADDFARGAKAAVEGRFTPLQVMEQIAENAAFHVAETIQQVTSPPLAAATIKAKGFSKPLIDSSLMFNSVRGVAVRTGG